MRTFISGPTGSSLANMGGFLQAADTEAGNTNRAKIAANAAQMASYFNMISNKARTEADSKAKEAENARGYFALNMQDAQKKAQLSQETALEAQKWGEQAKIQAGTLEAQQKIAELNNAGLNERSKLQFSDTRVTPQVALEKERQKGLKEEAAQMAGSLAGMANQALSAAKAKKKIVQQTVWDAKSTPEARQLGMANADQLFQQSISEIQAGLGDNAALVRFNSSIGQFEPAFTAGAAGQVAASPVRMIPPELQSMLGAEPQRVAAPVRSPQPAQTSGNVIWRIGPNGKLIRAGAPVQVPYSMPEEVPMSMF